jgi:hypothetical protein
MTSRPQRCRYCGTPIQQAPTGRPRQFCGDPCRRLHADVMRSLEPRERPPFGAPLFHSADAERRLRALHAELRSTSRSCYQIANELQLSGDLLNEGRFTAAGAALEHVLDAHFADLEGGKS